jgi:hypothetical protein
MVLDLTRVNGRMARVGRRANLFAGAPIGRVTAAKASSL